LHFRKNKVTDTNVSVTTRMNYFPPPRRCCSSEAALIEFFLNGFILENSLNDLNGLKSLKLLNGSNLVNTGEAFLLNPAFSPCKFQNVPSSYQPKCFPLKP